MSCNLYLQPCSLWLKRCRVKQERHREQQNEQQAQVKMKKQQKKNKTSEEKERKKKKIHRAVAWNSSEMCPHLLDDANKRMGNWSHEKQSATDSSPHSFSSSFFFPSPSTFFLIHLLLLFMSHAQANITLTDRASQTSHIV